MSEELRKVLKLGQATLAITLPRSWVKAVNLREGDVLRIKVFEGDKLLLEKVEGKGEVPVVVSFTPGEHLSEPNLLKRMIIGAYMNGVDLIFVPVDSRNSEHVLREVGETTKVLFGSFITESTEDVVIFQVIVDPRMPTLNTSIMRMHLLIFNMVRTSIRALAEDNLEYVKGLEEVCEDCSKIYWLAVRQLLKAQSDHSLLRDLKIKSHLWIIGSRAVLSILRYALHLAEEIKDLVRDVESLEDEAKDYVKMLRDITEELYETSDNIIRSLLAHDALRANRGIERIRMLKNKLGDLEVQLSNSHLKSKTIFVIGKLAYILKELGYCYKMVGEVAINRSVEITGKYSTVDLGRHVEELEEYL